MNTRNGFILSRIRYLFVLWMLLISTGVYAESAENGWQVSFPVYLTAIAYYQTNGHTSTAFESVAPAVEVLFSNQYRPYSAGLFYEYGHSFDQRYTGTVDTGGYFEYEHHKWDTTAYLFKNYSPGYKSLWLVGGRARYRFHEKHRFGIETFSSFKNFDSTTLAIGYYGSISKDVSLKLVVGSSVIAGQNQSVRAAIEWQIK